MIRRQPHVNALRKGTRSAILGLILVNINLRKNVPVQEVRIMLGTRVRLLNMFKFRISITRLDMMRIIRHKNARCILMPNTGYRALPHMNNESDQYPTIRKINDSRVNGNGVTVVLIRRQDHRLRPLPISLYHRRLLLIRTRRVIGFLRINYRLTMTRVTAYQRQRPLPKHRHVTRYSMTVLLVVVVICANDVVIFQVINAMTRVLVNVLNVRLRVIVLLRIHLVKNLRRRITIPLTTRISVLITRSPRSATQTTALAIMVVGIQKRSALRRNSLSTSMTGITINAASRNVFVLQVVTRKVITAQINPLAVSRTTPTLSLGLSVHLHRVNDGQDSARLRERQVLYKSPYTRVRDDSQNVLQNQLTVIRLIYIMRQCTLRH